MLLRKNLMVLVLVSLMLIVGSVSVWAVQDAAEFYKGKTITIYDSYSSGSDFARQARLLAPFIKEATGAKDVRLESKSGAGGLISRNWFYNDAKNDGLTILIDHGPKIIQYDLFDMEGVEYNWEDFEWIGKIAEENLIFAVGKDLGINNLDDLAKEESVLVGVSKPFYEPIIMEALGMDMMGLKKLNIVPGYPSPAEKVVSIARGEIQSCVGNTFSFLGSLDIVQPLVITFPHKSFPGVPTVREMAPDDRMKWVEYLEAFEIAQYSFIAPPGTPADRVKFLEECLHKVYDNPEVEEALSSQNWDKTEKFIGSQELNQITKSIADMTPEEVKDLKYVVEEKYMILK